MSSLVLELQQELLKGDCDILQALRKAHVIASKLKLTEFDLWVQRELNGYNCSYEEIPEYRNIQGTVKLKNPIHGWIPVMIEDRQEETLLTNRKVFQSVGEIEQLSKYDKKLLINFPGGISQKISEMAEAPMVFEAALFITNESLNGIVEKVKNCLLEWTLKLEEEGILGEGMLFSEKEAASAKILSNQTNNYFGTVIQGSVSNSQIVSGNSNAVTYNVDKLFTTIEDIRKSLEMESMTEEDKDSALEILEDISSKIGQNKKAGIIKSALVGLKDFTLSAGASVTAALIATQLQTLF